MTRYPILQSGFITFNEQGLRKPVSNFDAFQANILGKAKLEPNTDYFYHHDLHNLFMKLFDQNKTIVINDIHLYETVIENAVEAFGTKNFFDWIQLQDNNNLCSPIHHKFILETLEFIANGTPRPVHSQQWYRLLDINSINALTTIQSSQYYQRLGVLKKTLPHGLAKIIVLWCKQPDGFYDFMCCLEAIFGCRRTLNSYLG